ncbi:dienelactone hydrolase family protein [Microbaculum marinum]|uniref:Dienelactone hydrolase family protein n=1 Tax=Microbaculum marinum TaxID=1764581 RepID=A0AAW9RSM7_9HYPH
MPKLILWGLFAVGAVLLVVALNTGRQYLEWSPFDETPAERAERLAGHWRLVRPEGPGPHPAAILLSGCDGVRDNMDYWAGVLVETGRAALIVDSHTPRGLNRLESWRLVCAGQTLSGAERAGDIAVALQALPQLGDFSDDVVIFGASHGGWSAMEFIAHAVAHEPIPGLAGWPEDPDALLGTVSALVLLYPYCGALNSATAERWSGAPPALLVLAEKDSVVSSPDCIALADALDADGASVEVALIAGADHGFDQREKSPFSTLEFDAGQREQAATAVLEFLSRLDGARASAPLMPRREEPAG